MKKQLILIAVFALLSSCRSTELLPGYKLMDAPNSSDKPGRVYRMTDDGKTDLLVEYLPVSPQGEKIVISDREKAKKLSSTNVFSFVSNGKLDLGSKVGANFEKTATFNFKLRDCEVYKISDADLRPHLTELRNRIKEDIDLFGIKNPRYFILREAVTAKEILIQFDKRSKNNANLMAEYQMLVEANSNLSWARTNKSEIKVTLSDGVFVFYKPEQLSLMTGISGEPRLKIQKVQENDLIQLRVGAGK